MCCFGKRVQKCVDRCNGASNPSCVTSTKNGKKDQITRTNCKADRFYENGRKQQRETRRTHPLSGNDTISQMDSRESITAVMAMIAMEQLVNAMYWSVR